MSNPKAEELKKRIESEYSVYERQNEELDEVLKRLAKNKLEYAELHARRRELSEEPGNLMEKKLDEIRELQQQLSDIGLPRVEFLSHPFKGEWVVDKVTPKRVYLRKAGTSLVVIFHPNGYTSLAEPSGTQIDYEKTRSL